MPLKILSYPYILGMAQSDVDQQQMSGGEEKVGGDPPGQQQEFNPFSEADLERILREEKSSNQEEGWKFMSRTETAEVWRKSEPDKPVHLIKGFLWLPGVPPKAVVEMINNLELRRRWDRQFPVIDVIEQHPTHRVVYWLVKMPPAVADRDIVQYISQRTDESTDTTTILYRNATHPSRPERRGIVRAETILSGTIVRPDSKDPNSTRISILLQNDVKGWIPHFLVNAFAARAPGQWRDTLFDFYQNVYSKELSEQKMEGK